MERDTYVKVAMLMKKEALKRNAPVYQAASYLKNKPWLRFIFVVLSSRTHDETTLKAVKKIEKLCNSWECIKQIENNKMAEILRGIGFHKQKVRYLKAIASKLKRNEVPCDYEKLISLPGIGRKIANVVLADICGKDVIGVDTHVHRISNRLGWVNAAKPEETEQQLYVAIPKKLWNELNKAMVGFGQTVCLPKNPRCEECPVRNWCKEYKKQV